MTKNKIIIALVIVALGVLGYFMYQDGHSQNNVGLVNQCADGQTCLPSLEITGPNSGVTYAMQIDSGTFRTAGAAIFDSTLTASGGLISSSTNMFATTTFLGSVTIANYNGNTTPRLNIVSTNTATSTLIAGCIGTYATSTLTPVYFVLSSAGTTTATFGGAGVQGQGGVSWNYGSCPK